MQPLSRVFAVIEVKAAYFPADVNALCAYTNAACKVLVRTLSVRPIIVEYNSLQYIPCCLMRVQIQEVSSHRTKRWTPNHQPVAGVNTVTTVPVSDG